MSNMSSKEKNKRTGTRLETTNKISLYSFTDVWLVKRLLDAYIHFCFLS